MPTHEQLAYAPIQVISVEFASIVVKRRFVGMSLTAAAYCAANAKALGVSPDDYDIAAGETGAVITKGIAFVQASAEIAVGAAVASTSTGKAVTATALTGVVASGATAVTSTGAQPTITTAGSVTAQAICGYALTGAAADGDYILVQLA